MDVPAANFDEKLLRNRERILNLILKSNVNQRPKSIGSPRSVDHPIGHVLLVRGFASAHDDQTFKRLESLLPEQQIAVHRHSYSGFSFSSYDPINTLTSLDKQVKFLITEVHELAKRSKNLPIWILGHSFGGLVCADMITRYADKPRYQGLFRRIERIFFLGAPVFPLVNQLLIRNPVENVKVQFLIGRYMRHTSRVLALFPRIVSIMARNDRIVFREESSFKYNLGATADLREEVLAGKHLSICNLTSVEKIVMDEMGLR